MPDFQNFKITVQADQPGVNVARVTVEARVQEGGAVLHDFTGANAINFLFRVQGFMAAQHRELAEELAHWLVRKKAGL